MSYHPRMQHPTTRLVVATIGLLLAGCATRSLPKYEKPLACTQFQTVRTTSYTHTESDHLEYGRCNALGCTLKSGSVQSAAADWSRWPAGTTFRVLETGELYRVDDYGWTLTGTNTIDLYKPSRAQMNSWGVRRVNIEILDWGDPNRSLAVLRPRGKYRHVRKMIAEIEDRRAELQRPVQASASLAMTTSAGRSTSSPLTPFMRSARD